MGVNYTLILVDEFDWDYVDTNKTEELERFIDTVSRRDFKRSAKFYKTRGDKGVARKTNKISDQRLPLIRKEDK